MAGVIVIGGILILVLRDGDGRDKESASALSCPIAFAPTDQVPEEALLGLFGEAGQPPTGVVLETTPNFPVGRIVVAVNGTTIPPRGYETENGPFGFAGGIGPIFTYADRVVLNAPLFIGLEFPETAQPANPDAEPDDSLVPDFGPLFEAFALDGPDPRRGARLLGLDETTISKLEEAGLLVAYISAAGTDERVAILKEVGISPRPSLASALDALERTLEEESSIGADCAGAGAIRVGSDQRAVVVNHSHAD